MLCDLLVQLKNFPPNAIAQPHIFRSADLFMAQQTAVVFLKQREQSLSQLVESLAHFGPNEDIRAKHRLRVDVGITLFVVAQETIVDHVLNDFVLLAQFSVVGLEAARAVLGLGGLLQ